jgi:hypothetical protein
VCCSSTGRRSTRQNAASLGTPCTCRRARSPNATSLKLCVASIRQQIVPAEWVQLAITPCDPATSSLCVDTRTLNVDRINVFEGDEVEWIVDEIVNESFGAVAGALGTWRELVEDPHGSRGPSTPGERRGLVPGQAKTWRRDSLAVDGSGRRDPGKTYECSSGRRCLQCWAAALGPSLITAVNHPDTTLFWDYVILGLVALVAVGRPVEPL